VFYDFLCKKQAILIDEFLAFKFEIKQAFSALKIELTFKQKNPQLFFIIGDSI